MAEAEVSLLAAWPTLNDADLAHLRDDFDAWLKQVIARHGVEVAWLLYPEEPRAQEMYAGLESIGLTFESITRS